MAIRYQKSSLLLYYVYFVTVSYLQYILWETKILGKNLGNVEAMSKSQIFNDEATDRNQFFMN